MHVAVHCCHPRLPLWKPLCLTHSVRPDSDADISTHLEWVWSIKCQSWNVYIVKLPVVFKIEARKNNLQLGLQANYWYTKLSERPTPWYHWPHSPVCNITQDCVWESVFSGFLALIRKKDEKASIFLSCHILLCYVSYYWELRVHMTVELWTIFYPETWVMEIAASSPEYGFLHSPVRVSSGFKDGAHNPSPASVLADPLGRSHSHHRTD